jgi:hypothetical protein
VQAVAPAALYRPAAQTFGQLAWPVEGCARPALQGTQAAAAAAAYLPKAHDKQLAAPVLE